MSSNFTPHQKEWERLSGIPIEEQTYERNREAVDRIGATVVLKNMVQRFTLEMKIINYLSVAQLWQLVVWVIL